MAGEEQALISVPPLAAVLSSVPVSCHQFLHHWQDPIKSTMTCHLFKLQRRIGDKFLLEASKSFWKFNSIFSQNYKLSKNLLVPSLCMPFLSVLLLAQLTRTVAHLRTHSEQMLFICQDREPSLGFHLHGHLCVLVLEIHLLNRGTQVLLLHVMLVSTLYGKEIPKQPLFRK